MFLKSGGGISGHLFPSKRCPSAGEAASLSTLFHSFESNLRLRLLSLVPAPEVLTLPYLSRAVEVIASAHADCGALLSDPSLSDPCALASYLDTSVLLLDACNAIAVDIERLRRGDLHLRLASHLILLKDRNSSEARASISEWQKDSVASGGAKQSPPLPFHARARAARTMSAVGRAIYAVETVSSLLIGVVMSAVGGGGRPGPTVSEEFAWAGAYNDLAAQIGGRGGGPKETSDVRFNVGRLTDAMEINGDGGDKKTEKLVLAATELEASVGRMTEGLDALRHAADGLFRSVMAIRTTALGGFSFASSRCKS